MKSWIMLGFLMLISFSFVSAEVEVGFGQGSGRLGVNIILPEPVGITNVSNETVNHSDTTDTILTNIGAISNFNDTQFNNNAETLTIDESWLTIFINSFGFLTSIINIFDQSLNTTDDVTFRTMDATVNISEGGVNLEDKYQRKVNPGDMLMGVTTDGKFFMRIS